MRVATIAATVGLAHVRYRRFGIFMFCFERGDQRVFGIHRENLRPGSEPEAYDICRHELSPAERKTRVHISRKGHMLSPQSLAEACDTRRFQLSTIQASLSLISADAKGRLR